MRKVYLEIYDARLGKLAKNLTTVIPDSASVYAVVEQLAVAMNIKYVGPLWAKGWPSDLQEEAILNKYNNSFWKAKNGSYIKYKQSFYVEKSNKS